VVQPAIDEIDRQILAALARDGRATVKWLADLVGLSAASVHERLRKLEAARVVCGYAALVDPESVGRSVAAFIAFSFGPGVSDREAIDVALAAEPSILEVHEVAGEDCYLLKLRVGSPQELSVAIGRLRQISPTVTTRTTVVLRTVLERPLLAAGA
jgi:Lrp/AsnC family leucine-responsive transcriptional regulator